MLDKDFRLLVRQEQQRRAEEQRALAENRTLVESEYLSSSSSDEGDRRKRPRVRESSPKKLQHREKRKGILKDPRAKSTTKKRVAFNDVTHVREIPKDDVNRGAVMLPGDKLLLAAFKARSGNTTAWLSKVEGVSIHEEIEEEELSHETETETETPHAQTPPQQTETPIDTHTQPKQQRDTALISSIEHAEAAYRDAVLPEHGGEKEWSGKSRDRHDGFFDENEANISNEGSSTDYSVVITSNFDKQDQLENQFQEFEASIKHLEEAQSAATKASETLERIQVELKQEVASTSVESDYVSALRERVNARGRALMERVAEGRKNEDGEKDDTSAVESMTADGLSTDIEVLDDWWRNKKLLER